MQAYPEHLVQQLSLEDGTAVTIRPIRPGDADLVREFVRNLSDEARHFRFMDSTRELSQRMLSHFTEIDYESHLALIATTLRHDREMEIGVARYVADADRRRGEFALVVADDWQHKGLGTRLMQALAAAARAAGIDSIFGEVLPGNQKMLRLASRLGFVARFDESDPRVIRVELRLRQA